MKMYLALCTASPTQTGTSSYMHETANKGGYKRIIIVGGKIDYSKKPTTIGTISNTRRIEFPKATASWKRRITHFAVVDSGIYGKGNMWFYGKIYNPHLVKIGDRIVFVKGSMKLRY